MAVGRRSHTATLLQDGRVLIAGGESHNGAPTTVYASAELYDPATGVFNDTGAMNEPRTAHTATLLNNGKVLVVGGVNTATGLLASAELYDPSSATFTGTGSLHAPRYFHTATLLADGRVLIAGGENADAHGYNFPLSSGELYDPSTGTFTTCASSLTHARLGHTATLLDNGSVLIAGGQETNSTGDTLASAELYNPSTDTFTPTGSMSIEREYHASALLRNGKVLVAGGQTPLEGMVATAELYDPATGSFTDTGSMTVGRFLPIATLLNDGKVLVAAGWVNGNASVSAELYDPNQGTFSLTAGEMSTGRYEGTGTLLKPVPTPTPAPAELSFAPGRVKFPAQVVMGYHGAMSKPVKVRIFNLKNRRQYHPIEITDIGTDDSEFEASKACIGTLVAGASCPISITFTPNQAGKRSGNLIVNSNATNPIIEAQLLGVGRLGKIAIRPRRLNFGRVMEGSSMQKSLTLINRNLVPMDIGAITTANPHFKASGCANTEISPMSSCVVVITFRPESAGWHGTILTIHDSAAGSPHRLHLVGTGR